MPIWAALSSKAQMKIQQMIFMLVALMIFFGMVGIVYFTITFSNLKEKSQELRDQQAQALARQIAATPELTFSQRGTACSECVDLDKAKILAEDDRYKRMYWNIDYLAIETVYPRTNCPLSQTDCNFITIIDKNPGNYSGTRTSPIAIVWWDANLGSNGDYRYALGRVHILTNGIK